jgi:hypothetical protein
MTSELKEWISNVASRDELVSFVEALTANLSESPNDWENITLGSYLEALGGFVGGHGGRLRQLRAIHAGTSIVEHHCRDSLRRLCLRVIRREQCGPGREKLGLSRSERTWQAAGSFGRWS